MSDITDQERREQFELELAQIKKNIQQTDIYIAQMKTDTALSSKKLRWYEAILIAGFVAGLITLGIALGDFARKGTMPVPPSVSSE